MAHNKPQFLNCKHIKNDELMPEGWYVTIKDEAYIDRYITHILKIDLAEYTKIADTFNAMRFKISTTLTNKPIDVTLFKNKKDAKNFVTSIYTALKLLDKL